jgi:hypothetical protein
MSYRFKALALSALLLIPAQAIAQTAPAAPASVPSIPGGDIFGFTSSSDTGSPGDRGVAFETTSRFSRDSGSYWFTTLKTQFATTLAPNLSVAFSPFTTFMSIQNSALYNPANGRTEFDGFSGEATWRFLERGPSGIAAALSIEPRWARVDGNAGGRVEAWSAEMKLFVDAVLIQDRLFAAMNINYAPGTTRTDAGDGTGFGGWVAGSSTNISFALATPVNDRITIGLETRFLGAFTGSFLNNIVGNAVFVGPNALFKLTDNASLNVAWTPQVSGNAVGVPGRNDLTNFERHQLRVKLAVSF